MTANRKNSKTGGGRGTTRDRNGVLHVKGTAAGSTPRAADDSARQDIRVQADAVAAQPDSDHIPVTTRYAEFPDHPLRDVPQEVLDAARKMMHDEVVRCGDVDADLADPIADLMVIAVLPWLRWDDQNGRNEDGPGVAEA